MTNGKPPFPPVDRDAALKKVRAAEDAWNSRDPDRVAMAYSQNTHWRNRAEIFRGRDAAREFLRRKRDKELDYRLVKEMWAFLANRIAVRFQYEWRDDAGQWYRAHGNELWQFDDDGLMNRREASINDKPIAEGDRRFHWPIPGVRPDDHPGLIDSPE